MHVIRGCRVRAGPLGAYRVYRALRHNADVIRESVDFYKYDLIIGDEPWELMMLGSWPHERSAVITDFTAFRASGRLSSWVINRLNGWMVSSFSRFALRFNVSLWDSGVPGFESPGQLFTHDGFGQEPSEIDRNLVVINIGGTDSAEGLADILAAELNRIGLKAVTIGGSKNLVANPLPLISRARALVTLAGYSSLVEAAYLRKRSVILKIDGHFEHEENARAFEDRPGYRVINCSEAKPDAVAKLLLDVMSEEPSPPAVKDSSQVIAERLKALVEGDKV